MSARPLAIAIFALSLSMGAARAQQNGQERWEISVTPYLWVAGIGGTLSTPLPRAQNLSASADFGDLLSNLSGFGLWPPKSGTGGSASWPIFLP